MCRAQSKKGGRRDEGLRRWRRNQGLTDQFQGSQKCETKSIRPMAQAKGAKVTQTQDVAQYLCSVMRRRAYQIKGNSTLSTVTKWHWSRTDRRAQQALSTQHTDQSAIDQRESIQEWSRPRTRRQRPGWERGALGGSQLEGQLS